ncbi:hypothetical protein BC831DRAFT_549308 [Entophlyctis helioformis]|nr:hypothetical protein BC831DRAFT_549308 [Entophlyctis helioformis]
MATFPTNMASLDIVETLVKGIVSLADNVRTNRAAATALAHHAELVTVTLANQVGDSQGPAVLANIAELEAVLSRIDRFLAKTAAKNALQQALAISKTADTIRSLDAELVQLQQSLQLAVAFQADAVAKAIAQDTADLPTLMAQLMATKFDMQQQQLETLLAIKEHQEQLLAVLPDQVRPRATELLESTKQSIMMRSGRGLSAPHEWSVDPDDVDIFSDRKIGEGSYGQIFHGEWNGRRVAIKVISGAIGREAIEAIEKEAAVWFLLRHPNVLPLWRVCLNTNSPFLVMPLMHSDVAAFLRKAPETPMAVRVHLLLGAARGMQHLHELPNPVIHGDLKANNILIGFDGEACITDFGLAFIKTSSSANTNRKGGATCWIAPEKYKRGYTLAPPSDVFAFAMTALQVLTGKVPFAKKFDDEIVKDWVIQGERPNRPDGIPDSLWAIIEDCLAHDPAQRPTFRQVAARLNMLPHTKPDFGAQPAASSLVASMASISLAGQDLKPPAAQPAAPDNQQLPRVSLRFQNQDSGYAASQPKISDAERLVKAFPEWRARKGITAANAQSFDGVVNFQGSEYRILEWENGHLVRLHMYHQDIKSPLPPHIGGFSHLKTLNLLNNKLTRLPETIGNLTQLTELYLSDNQLTQLPESIGNLTKLTELGLRGNKLTQLPESIGNLTQLTVLGLYGNQLTQLPESIGNLTQLTVLNLWNNQLTQLPESIGNLTQLTELGLYGNQLTQLPESIGNLTQLTVLNLWNNQLTQLPETIGNLTQLIELNLWNNQLTQLPESIGNLTQLTELGLYGNQLTQLPESIGNLTWLTWLYLSDNQLTQLPETIGNLTQLIELDLCDNQLTQLPESIGNLTQLTELYLSDNQLTQLPESIGNLTWLTELYLSDNQLTQLPESIGNLTWLTWLNLWNNQLTQLPESIGNLTWLTGLNLYGNQLTKLPEWIGNLKKLTVLLLSKNQLEGSVPSELGKLTNLTKLCLDNNKLSGSIPTELGHLTNLTVLLLSKNQLEGSVPSELGKLANLTELHLDNNKLSGSIPLELGHLTNLTVLNNLFQEGADSQILQHLQAMFNPPLPQPQQPQLPNNVETLSSEEVQRLLQQLQPQQQLQQQLQQDNNNLRQQQRLLQQPFQQLQLQQLQPQQQQLNYFPQPFAQLPLLVGNQVPVNSTPSDNSSSAEDVLRRRREAARAASKKYRKKKKIATVLTNVTSNASSAQTAGEPGANHTDAASGSP